MNEEVKNALTGIINTVVDCKDFVLEQAPDVIHQLLQYNYVMSLAGFCIGVVLLLVLIPAIKNAKKTKWTGYGNDEAQAAAFFFILIPALTAALVMFLNLTWLKILIAPKVYLLEYAANLM